MSSPRPFHRYEKPTGSFLLWFVLFSFFAGAIGEALAKEPSAKLSDPPLVTARAWAVGDGKSGKLLWSFNADQPLKSASTTKIMCAFVVLQLASKDPGVLDETVTFSKLAGTTGGSTAAIKPGESLSVRDCLYGLLLPSGNDAGNALAEHFNSRFAPADESIAADLSSTNLATRAKFIAEMNRTAHRLGMTNTIYRSSFGDGGTETDRTTTARDLLKVAWTAMQSSSFRHYVSTTRHDCRVLQANGEYRGATWNNGNKLLEIEGYDGIKTGTTTTARNCLVSSGHHGKDHLLIVVLGSDSDRGRYVDTQNLFRWAWLKRGHKS